MQKRDREALTDDDKRSETVTVHSGDHPVGRRLFICYAEYTGCEKQLCENDAMYNARRRGGSLVLMMVVVDGEDEAEWRSHQMQSAGRGRVVVEQA